MSRIINYKKGISLVQLGIFIAITPIVLLSVSYMATKAYSLYNSYNIRSYVLSENVKFNKALGGIRFANQIDFVDETPAAHNQFSQINLILPENETLSFTPINLGEDTNDVGFYRNGSEVYTYDQDYIDLKKFKVTVLDNSLNRQSLKLDIKIGVDGKNNKLARTKFGGESYYIDYTTTLTLRNNSGD